LYWLVPGLGFSFAAGVANAWLLLVEVVRYPDLLQRVIRPTVDD